MIPSKCNQMIGTVLLAVFLALPATAADDKKKNSDVENIGDRNINKGSINFTSIEKEMVLGRGLAAEGDQDAQPQTAQPRAQKALSPVPVQRGPASARGGRP